jgi:hypothetical protein
MPRTGGALPTNDPNLDLSARPGFLQITASYSDINNGGSNLGIAEAPGVFLHGIGTQDLAISTLVSGVNVLNANQFWLYVATPTNDTLRAGLHNGGNFPDQYIFVENWSGTGFSDFIPFGSGTGLWATGDDIVLTLSRTDGLWSLSWNNLNNPSLNGAFPGVSLPWLDSSPDLYVGVSAENPSQGGFPRATFDIAYFTVTTPSTTVPEPSVFALFAAGVICLFGYSSFQSWKSKKGVESFFR